MHLGFDLLVLFFEGNNVRACTTVQLRYNELNWSVELNTLYPSYVISSTVARRMRLYIAVRCDRVRYSEDLLYLLCTYLLLSISVCSSVPDATKATAYLA